MPTIDSFLQGITSPLGRMMRPLPIPSRQPEPIDLTSGDVEDAQAQYFPEMMTARSNTEESINQSINQTCMPVGSPFGRRRSAKTKLICTIIYTRPQIFNFCKIEWSPQSVGAKVSYLALLFATHPFARNARKLQVW